MLTQPLRLIHHICWKVFMRTPGPHLDVGSTSSVLPEDTSSPVIFTPYCFGHWGGSVSFFYSLHLDSLFNCVKQPPLFKKKETTFSIISLHKQMWHRSKDVPKNDSFWKEPSSCANENDQFRMIGSTMAPAVLASERSKQRSLRRPSTALVLSHSRHPGQTKGGRFNLTGARQGLKRWRLSRGAAS